MAQINRASDQLGKFLVSCSSLRNHAPHLVFLADVRLDATRLTDTLGI